MGDTSLTISKYPEPAFCFTPDAEFPLICGLKGVYHAQFTSQDRWCKQRKIVELDGGTVPNAIPGLQALVRADALPMADTDSIEGAGVEDGAKRPH